MKKAIKSSAGSISRDSDLNSFTSVSTDSLSLISSDIRLLTMTHLQNNLDEQLRNSRQNEGDQIVSADEFLIWNNPENLPSPLFPPNSLPPYIVLMESLNQSLNIGKLNPIAVADLIHSVIKGNRLIQRSGINRVKITCESLDDANVLLGSSELIENKYRVYIPKSLKFVKGMVREVDCSLSANNIADRMNQESLKDLVSIKRRITYDNHMLDIIELTYLGSKLPSTVQLSYFEFPVVPIDPRPLRCYKCQRYRHVETQCRSRYFRCEFCLESHESKDRHNRLRSVICCNCNGPHSTASVECPRYIKEKVIMQIRLDHGIGYQEAEAKFNENLSEAESDAQESTIRDRNNIDTSHPMDLSLNSVSSHDSHHEEEGDQSQISEFDDTQIENKNIRSITRSRSEEKITRNILLQQPKFVPPGYGRSFLNSMGHDQMSFESNSPSHSRTKPGATSSPLDELNEAKRKRLEDTNSTS
ncbi:uncharacterized protein LOC127285312 [Leptopilina boulardi]|uniref:uncharacterized protein LOC127285312 n=1 Tax=Leptopilina boulardi TaxID=63433 RepID=UPI0021F64125|nr:uncharacterized protein LOC127285312 [Leptopilina boulardi]